MLSRHRTGLVRYLARPVFLFFTAFLLITTSLHADAFTNAEKSEFQRSIIDYRHRLNRRFKKVRRAATRYIVVHTSEGGLEGTLRVVSKGKRVRGRYRTRGGHAHYVIARDGRTYRVLDRRYRADHAGRSMWDGERDISSLSVGIELVGYHYSEITDAQYRSVGILIDILQDIYSLDDQAVLTHSQVAYGRPNRWIRRNHRGRKRCAENFDRARAGCDECWAYDPDVKAGRLAPDRKLAAIFYSNKTSRAKPVVTAITSEIISSNIISKANSAWNIAGGDYDDPTTLYQLPGGRIIPGDQIAGTIGWGRIPAGTAVLLNQEDLTPVSEDQSPIKTITNGLTAWTLAGPAYRKESTYYLFPGGKIRTGKEISDWDDLPSKTRMLIGYRGPYKVTGGRPPVKIAGASYNSRSTVYLLPNRKLKTGDEISNFKKLPRGTIIFLPARAS